MIFVTVNSVLYIQVIFIFEKQKERKHTISTLIWNEQPESKSICVDCMVHLSLNLAIGYNIIWERAPAYRL